MLLQWMSCQGDQLSGCELTQCRANATSVLGCPLKFQSKFASWLHNQERLSQSRLVRLAFEGLYQQSFFSEMSSRAAINFPARPSLRQDEEHETAVTWPCQFSCSPATEEEYYGQQWQHSFMTERSWVEILPGDGLFYLLYPISSAFYIHVPRGRATLIIFQEKYTEPYSLRQIMLNIK